MNHSQWDNTLEGSFGALALRLGMRQIDGFRQDWATAIGDARTRPFESLEGLMRRA